MEKLTVTLAKMTFPLVWEPLKCLDCRVSRQCHVKARKRQTFLFDKLFEANILFMTLCAAINDHLSVSIAAQI